MKKIFYSITGLLLVFLLAFFIPWGEINNNEALNEVIYYIPHQDDEVITFGVSIHDHVVKGYDVHVVLLTDGANSAVRNQLDLTKEEFSLARDREFDKAVDILGVDAKNVVKTNYSDGSLKIEQVEAVMKEYMEKYPNASHKTFSYLDPHPDHANAGVSLKNLMDQGVISDGKFYHGNNFTPLNVDSKKDHYDDSYQSIIIDASRAYKEEDLQNGLYGIGWKSVPEYFKALEDNPVSPYHE